MGCIGNTGARIIIGALKKNDTLESLDLSFFLIFVTNFFIFCFLFDKYFFGKEIDNEIGEKEQNIYDSESGK